MWKSCQLSVSDNTNSQQSGDNHVVAPRVENSRVKVQWSDTGVENYCQVVCSGLSFLRNLWSDTMCPPVMSILVSSTNEIMKCQTISKISNGFKA